MGDSRSNDFLLFDIDYELRKLQMLIKQETVLWMSNCTDPIENDELLIKVIDGGKIYFYPGTFKEGFFVVPTEHGLQEIHRHVVLAWTIFPKCEARH